MSLRSVVKTGRSGLAGDLAGPADLDQPSRWWQRAWSWARRRDETIATANQQVTASWVTRAVTVALWGCVAMGPLALIAAWAAISSSGSPAPTAAAVAPDRAEDRAVVGEYAQRVVTTWLTATDDNPDALAAMVVGADLAVLAKVPYVVRDPAVARILEVDDTWSVTVAATVTDARKVTDRRYFQVPVRLDGGVVSALTLPSPVSPPLAGMARSTSYRTQVGADSSAATAVGEFLSAYLAGSGDVSRYLTPGVALTGLTPAPYTGVRLQDVRADADIDLESAPSDGQQLRVLVTASVTSTDDQASSVSYALTLTARAGRWEITAIDPAPAFAPPPPGAATAPDMGLSPESPTPTPTAP